MRNLQGRISYNLQASTLFHCPEDGCVATAIQQHMKTV